MFEEFRRIGRFLFQEGLVDSHGGNMSVRQGDKILITARNVMLGDLKESDIIEVGLESGDKDQLVSRELPSHRAIYSSTKAQAIIHAHPAAAIALSLTDSKIIPQDSEGLFLWKSASVVHSRDPIGSTEIIKFLVPALSGSNPVAMVKGHGSFAVGATLEEAYRLTSSLANSCRIIIALRSAKSAAPVLDRKVERKRAIPPGIGVMDRDRYFKR